MIPLAILGLSAILATVALNMVAGWDLKAAEACPGPADFCNGVWWTLVSDYLPVYLFFGLMLVTLALSSSRAIVRV